MAEPVRFFMDQHIPRPDSDGLRRHGADVSTTQDAARCGALDADQLAFATASGRVMVTFDADYLALRQTGIPRAGIAWCQEQKYAIGQLIRALRLLQGVLDADAMRNHLEYL